jgi:hypothetical protein
MRTRTGVAQRCTFDECRGSTQHDKCARRFDFGGLKIAECDCECHVTQVTA